MKHRIGCFYRLTLIVCCLLCGVPLCGSTALIRDAAQEARVDFSYYDDDGLHQLPPIVDPNGFNGFQGPGDANRQAIYEPNGFSVLSSATLTSSWTGPVSAKGHVETSAKWQARTDGITQFYTNAAAFFGVIINPESNVVDIDVSGTIEIAQIEGQALSPQDLRVEVSFFEMPGNARSVLLWEVALDLNDDERTVEITYSHTMSNDNKYRFEIAAYSMAYASEYDSSEVTGMANYDVALSIPHVAYCRDILHGDVNRDCKVDLADLAEIASNWLHCNREPQDSCQN